MDPKTEAPYAGKPGQTTQITVQVTSDSGSTFPAKLYTTINVTRNPELREGLLAGVTHHVKCPYTDDTYELAHPVVYHDEEEEIFALVLPSSSRHREFHERAQLLEAISRDSSPVPGYVRQFATVFDPALVDSLEGGQTDPTETRERPKLQPPADLEASKELARQRSALDEERTNLQVEREQLDEVRERFDREREQMDEVEQRLANERSELEAARAALEQERQKLEAQKLNAERAEISEDVPANEEATQVVTDDQLIVVEEDEDVDGIDTVEATEIEAITSGVPAKFSELAGNGDAERVVKINDGSVVVGAKLERDAIERLFDEEVQFFTQLHDVDGYPLIALLVAGLEDGQSVEDIGWTLDVADTAHGLILDTLETAVALKAGFYDPRGGLLRAVEIRAPFAENIKWIRNESAKRLKDSKAKGKFGEATKAFHEDDFERLGSMQHNFERDSFSNIETPSEAKLAAGIVGFWSTAEKLEYLVANRGFPLSQFWKIQERVASAAVEHGIYINEPLRDVAIEMGLAEDEDGLVELLTANFAEVCVSIRSNDLDSGDQWDNWDALLGLGDDLGVPPDPDVVELAEVSLKRAQEIAEFEEVANEPTQMTDMNDLVEVNQTLVVARRSESTGVTYFLPESAIEDSFDDLAEMAREDLELLLNDANGRLEAAQMLLERFGASATETVLEASETMSAPEVAALAQFVETKADGLEGELVRCVESGGPSATYIAAHALASIKSTTALPALLDALTDKERSGDEIRLAATLADYGEKVIAPLTRAIKRDGSKDGLIQLLVRLEDVEEGTLNQLSKDRSKALREAAREAREIREQA